MKQIIRPELAEELGIPNPDRWNFSLVEKGKVLDRWNDNDETIQRLEDGAEYVGSDRKRLVGWKEQERWFLWQHGTRWGLEHYPSQRTLVGLAADIDVPLLDRVKFLPENYTEMTKTEANYILNKPDGEGWELRIVSLRCKYKTRHGVYVTADGSLLDQSFCTGLRWCQKSVLERWTMEDVPPVCWLKERSSSSSFLVRGVTTHNILVRSKYVSFETLSEDYKWSADLKTWKPCTKEQ